MPLILHHVGRIQRNPVSSSVSGDVSGVLCVGGTVFGPSTGFFLQFKPGVDVVGKEAGLGSWEVPDFVDLDDPVATTNGLFQFGHAPGTGESTFVLGMLAGGEICVDAGAAERESEFGFMTIGKNRMIEVGGWKDGAFS